MAPYDNMATSGIRMKVMNETLAIIIIDTEQNIGVPRSAQKIGGFPMLDHVMHAVSTLLSQKIVIVSDSVMNDKYYNYLKKITKNEVEIIAQQEEIKTKEAIELALSCISDDTNNILILHSNTPLIKGDSLKKVVKILSSTKHSEALPIAAILGFSPLNIDLHNKLILGEYHKDVVLVTTDGTSTEYRNYNDNLFCSNIIVINQEILKYLIQHTKKNNQHYVANLATTASAKKLPHYCIQVPENEMMTINNYSDLTLAEWRFQQIMRDKLAESGVQLIAPDTVQFSCDTKIQKNAIIHPYVVFGKGVIVRQGAEIKPFVYLEEICIEENSVVAPHSQSVNIEAHSTNPKAIRLSITNDMNKNSTTITSDKEDATYSD